MKINLFRKCILSYLPLLFLTLNFNCAYAESTTFHDSNYTVCFTPGMDCTQLIVKTLQEAKDSIFLQAYSFTSAPIAKAVVEAKQRGVAVFVILDKSQSPKNKYSSAKYLLDNNIETYIDYKPAIAHNKIIIVDGAIVLTGSFNFTRAAQLHNAENFIIIRDKELAKLYLANWHDRCERSMLARDYQRYRHAEY
jgi:phosphatidylserine/phosphatidylglycerophosphate/cardiolipin synthase-like enzyme